MKAILVVDMPESCKECQLKYLYTGDNAYFGGAIERCVIDGSIISLSGRYDDCPLKPMPMKRETHVYWKSVGIRNIPTHEISDYDKGWNDCVEFLEGEEND